MVCRHVLGDPSCTSGSSPKDLYKKGKELVEEWGPQLGKVLKTDNKNYRILDIYTTGDILVLKVEYPSCPSCSYEGVKIMVFLNVTPTDALKWREIDPHFRDPKSYSKISAPSPVARFPATNTGWEDAIDYAERIVQNPDR